MAKELVRVRNDEGLPVWWCVGGPHDGRLHDNPTCNCGGRIVPIYRLPLRGAALADTPTGPADGDVVPTTAPQEDM